MLRITHKKYLHISMILLATCCTMGAHNHVNAKETKGNAEQTSFSIDVFRGISEAIKSAAEAIAGVGDSFAHIINLGVSGYDNIEARTTANRIEDLLAQLKIFNSIANYSVVISIDEFIYNFSKGGRGNIPNEAVNYYYSHKFVQESSLLTQWILIKETTSGVIIEATNLLEEIKKERSDFVKEDAYNVLLHTLSSRVRLLSKFDSMPKPESIEEIEALKEISENYKFLIEKLESTNKLIVTYLDNHT